jgi:N utilization substance protein B
MGRRQVREQLFKLLFRIEFNEPEDMGEQEALFFEEEIKLEEAERTEIEGKFDTIVENLTKIDAMLNEKTTGWTTDRMGKVDLTILRLAVYEITMDEQVPTSVAINEAVELAKKYGGDESPAFINGVLAKFAKE